MTLFNGTIGTDEKLLDGRPMLRLRLIKKQSDRSSLKPVLIQMVMGSDKGHSQAKLSPVQAPVNLAKPRMRLKRFKDRFPSHNNTITYFNAKSNK